MEKLSRREREKQVRKEEIIDAAEKIFCEKGFEKASMDEIAKEAQFTKRTLYQYFINKNDLFFAVVLKGFTLLGEYCDDIDAGTNGFEKFSLVCRGYYKFYKDYPGLFRLMNYVGYVKTTTKDNKPLPHQQDFLNLDDMLFDELTKLIEEGKADGSIRSDIESQKTAYSSAFILNGFFYMLTITGKTFTEHFDLEVEEFVTFTLGLFASSLKNN